MAKFCEKCGKSLINGKCENCKSINKKVSKDSNEKKK